MTEWNSFETKPFDRSLHVYVTDHEMVWTCRFYEVRNPFNLVWSEIILPSPPKKYHRCVQREHKCFVCFEDKEGFWIEFSQATGRYTIEHCAVCGFKP